MRRILVVANETLGGEHLASEVERRAATGECVFHIVVPAAHPSTGWSAWTEGRCRAAAQERLDDAMSRFMAMGVEVTGEVGDPSPVLAIGDALLAQPFDEVLLSTLPLGVSRWLHQDVVSRVRRSYPNVRLTHLTAEPALTS